MRIGQNLDTSLEISSGKRRSRALMIVHFLSETFIFVCTQRIAMQLTSCEATTIVYRFLMKTVSEADIDLATEFQMNFYWAYNLLNEVPHRIIFPFCTHAWPKFSTINLLDQRVFCISFTSSGITSAIQIYPSGHVSHKGSLKVHFYAYRQRSPGCTD